MPVVYASAVAERQYIHGYATPEQERLIAQAGHWQDELILDGTHLAPGTRLLEVGCGVGAVLAVLGRHFPGIALAGVDIESSQIEFADQYLRGLGLDVDLRQADALALPFPDGSFDHIWMMWFLEHLADPVEALAEARRVLVRDGEITVIEVDYSSIHVEPASPEIDAFVKVVVDGMDAAGHSDAGARVPAWLAEAGFQVLDPGERVRRYSGDELARQAAYFADIWDSAIPGFVGTPGAPDEEQLRSAVAQVRELHARPNASLGWVIHKARATA